MADYVGTLSLEPSLQKLLNAYADFGIISKYVKYGLQDFITVDLDPATQDNLSNRILKRRTGALAQSVKWMARKTRGKGTYTLTASSGTPYGALLEHGGVIKPKKKYLTIPLPAAKTAAGVTKKSAREWENTFFHRSKAGRLVLLQSKGKKVVPLFLLVKQVKIPAFQWAFRSFDRVSYQLIDRISDRMPV